MRLCLKTPEMCLEGRKELLGGCSTANSPGDWGKQGKKLLVCSLVFRNSNSPRAGALLLCVHPQQLLLPPFPFILGCRALLPCTAQREGTIPRHWGSAFQTIPVGHCFPSLTHHHHLQSLSPSASHCLSPDLPPAEGKDRAAMNRRCCSTSPTRALEVGYCFPAPC